MNCQSSANVIAYFRRTGIHNLQMYAMKKAIEELERNSASISSEDGRGRNALPT